MIDHDLPPISYDEPPGAAFVGYWCWRGGGHICATACKSDSVPLFAQAGWATLVRENVLQQDT